MDRATFMHELTTNIPEQPAEMARIVASNLGRVA
jgi:hypothetical protein